MTKAEIIRKIAKRAGVQDLDAKIFFEVFLRKVSLQLNPGETIRIKNIGYLQMRTGKIKSSSAIDSNQVLADLILFHPLQKDLDETDGNIIFNIPYRTEEEYNVIDSYFTLSFGKPVIPLKDANISEYFIPPTGNELRRLFDSKADKLLQEVEVIDDFIKGGDILLIDPELINPNQMEINWDEINYESSSQEKPNEEIGKSSLTDSEAFSWTFGDELEKQIEEEALLDTGDDDNLFVEYDDLKDLSWDFGENISTVEDSPLLANTSPNNEIAKNLDKFQRVNSFTTDYHIDKNEIDPFELDKVNSDYDLLKSIKEELNDEGFAEIKHIPRNYKIEPKNNEISEENSVIPEKESAIPEENIVIPEVKSVIPEIKQEAPDTLVELNKLKNELNNFDSNVNLVPEPTSYKGAQFKEGYSKKKGIGFFIILAVLIVLTGTVFLYIKVINPYYAGYNKSVDTKADSYNIPPAIVERDYKIPVTYPYTKDTNVVHVFNPIEKNVFAPADKSINHDSIVKVTKVQKVEEVPVKQPAHITTINNIKSSEVKVNQFIYKSGDKYIVQISSWSSKNKALDHAAHFSKLGYQTNIETANLDRGLYYRVRVGNFNSENEAKKFYEKYK
jgi:nucleoid DNA-binding protein/cell division septation protein DedD